MRPFVLILLLPALLLLPGTPANSGTGEEESDCAMCHEEVVADFRDTAHARAPGWKPATACQSCHGDGEAHMESGGDPELIVRPQMLPPRESSDGCLECHGRHETHFSAARATHRLGEVGCIDCHNPHLTTDAMLVMEGADLCAGCHQAVAARFELPRAHPMAEEGPGCVACHDPHGSLTLRSDATRSGAVCADCHFEKAGPFLYDHDTTLVDGCKSCHEIHGSTNRHLLRHETQVNLCYECHNANVTPGWHSASRFLEEKCTACHTAIHGSNTSQFFLEE